MTKKDTLIRLENGLEARPVAKLVQVASQFESSVYIEYQEKRVNAKSIMGMMSLVLPADHEVTVTADGVDETEAVAAIVSYLSGV